MSRAMVRSRYKIFFSFFEGRKTAALVLSLYCVFTGAIPVIDGILLENITNLIESKETDLAALKNPLVEWAFIYAGWWVFINIAARLNDYLYLRVVPAVKGQALSRMYEYVQYHGHNFFQDNLVGTVSSRMSEASRTVETIFALFNEKIVHKLSTLIFTLWALYQVHYGIALIFLLWILLFTFISALYSEKMTSYSSNYGKKKATVIGRIVDVVTNINAVRMFVSYKFEQDYLSKYVGSAVTSERNMQWFMLKLRNILSLSCSAMIFALIYYIAILRSENKINIGECVLVISLAASVVDEIWDLTQEIGDFFEEIGNFSQSVSLISPRSVEDAPGAKDLKISKGEIEFRKVTFSYRYNSNIFKDNSIKIKGGTKVGLVGFSGSGKTTFVNLITRLYDIEKGKITIDGQDIRKITQNSLRDNISIIPQEPLLFNRTVMENIGYGKKSASDEEIFAAARIARAENFIKELPDGYFTVCGERGNNLSGGQRQRIIIARAILKNAPILIMDEATASLDVKTENDIKESMGYLMKNKTVIVIAHRLSTLLDMDRILVFDKGSIVGDGAHGELIQSNETYIGLWNVGKRIA